MGESDEKPDESEVVMGRDVDGLVDGEVENHQDEQDLPGDQGETHQGEPAER
jgi:hypothetical protein